MTTETKPTAAAMRAVERIGLSLTVTDRRRAAEIIDAETGLAGLVEAAQIAREYIHGWSGAAANDVLAVIDAALAAAEGGGK